MEDRRALHYHRNTVIVPKLSTRKHQIREQVGFGKLIKGDKTPQDTDHKICASLKCPWCDFVYEEYRAACTNCGNCFYCGLKANSTFECQICKNSLPQEDRQVVPKKTIRLA